MAADEDDERACCREEPGYVLGADEEWDLAGFLHTDLVFECAVLRSLSIPTSVRSDYA